MGLNITAYSRLETIREDDVKFQAHNVPEDRRIVSFFNNPDFPYHIAGADRSIFYKVKGEIYTFRAGSYSGYTDWRHWLAKVAGYDSAHDIWSKRPIAPFTELINFSDCEGAIGSLIAGKLARDFKENEAKAIELKDQLPFALERYYDWQRACEIAAKKGAISFH